MYIRIVCLNQSLHFRCSSQNVEFHNGLDFQVLRNPTSTGPTGALCNEEYFICRGFRSALGRACCYLVWSLALLALRVPLKIQYAVRYWSGILSPTRGESHCNSGPTLCDCHPKKIRSTDHPIPDRFRIPIACLASDQDQAFGPAS